MSDIECQSAFHIYSSDSGIKTSGFATSHVVVFLSVCKTSYHLLISPPPTNLPNTLKIHTVEKKFTARVASILFHYTRYFPANGSTNSDVF